MDKKKFFSTIGFAYFLLAGITLAISYLLTFVLLKTAPRVYYFSLMTWVISLGPMYLVGMPVCAKFMQRLPKMELFRNKITFGKWFSVLCICLIVMFVGNVIGNAVTSLIGNMTSLDMTFDLQEMLLSERPIYVFLFSVILAPILEELVFRKLLIDRAIVFGDKAAIFLSGFMFGLFHGNLYQVFYAFGLGCVLAYVYIRTGNIKYTITLHMAINFLGGFVESWFFKRMNLELLLSENFLNNTEMMMEYVFSHLGILLGYLAFIVFMLVLGIIGLVKLIQSIKSLKFFEGEYSVSAGKMTKYIFGNVGMWLFIAACVFLFAESMIP